MVVTFHSLYVYFKIGKFTAATGGANIMGLTEDDTALFFHGIAPSPPDSQNANSTCVIMTRANDNVFFINNGCI